MDLNCNKLFEIWKKICNDSNKEIITAWDSGSWSSYTETIMGPQNPNSILGKLKDEIHLSIYQEYYSCDAIFFDEEKCLKKEEIQDFLSDEVINAPSPFNQCWIKEIEIHLEHENNIKNAWQEIMQFCVIPGKINVLITYPNHAEEKIAINCYETILKSIDFKYDVLVIFGTHTKDENEVNWKGFQYTQNSKKFIELSNDNSLLIQSLL